MINPMDLSGKNILVTGASSGIGKEIATYLSKLGANVILVARNVEGLKATLSQLEDGKHIYYAFDVTKIGEIGALMDDIIKDDRILDGFVHSAGTYWTMPIRNLKYEDIHRVMLVNFYAFVEFSKIFSKKKYNNCGGSIVGISSVASFAGAKGCTAYCASKSALDSAVRVMALEFAGKNIRVNTVNPSWIRTEMYDDVGSLFDRETFANLLKRQPIGLGRPSDVAHAVAFLLSEASRFITGTSLKVDGGYLAQ